MTSLEESKSESENQIIVTCADGAECKVDLTLFPSETLINLRKSEFKDNRKTYILYDSDKFLKVYNDFLPDIYDYLCLPDHVKIIDMAIFVKEDGIEFENLQFSAYGKVKFSYKNKKYICKFDCENYELKRHSSTIYPRTYCTDIEFDVTFRSSKQKYAVHADISSDFMTELEYEEACEITITKELKKIIRTYLTRQDDGIICTNENFVEWFKYHLMDEE